MSAQYTVHAKFPGPRYSVYECCDTDDVQDAMFIVAENHGEITWIGEKYCIGVTPNGKCMMYEYREIQEKYK